MSWVFRPSNRACVVVSPRRCFTEAVGGANTHIVVGPGVEGLICWAWIIVVTDATTSSARSSHGMTSLGEALFDTGRTAALIDVRGLEMSTPDRRGDDVLMQRVRAPAFDRPPHARTDPGDLVLPRAPPMQFDGAGGTLAGLMGFLRTLS